MPRQEHIISCFVSSPSDVDDERSSLVELVEELNRTWSRQLGLRFELIGWDTHSVPGFGTDPQDVINSRIPTDYDVFLGIMWSRFGTTTPRAGSGTEEEFHAAKSRWDADNSSVHIMFYFKDAPILLPPSKIDVGQLTKVAAFRATLGSQGGLYSAFQSTEDFINQVRTHLSRIAQDWHKKLVHPQSAGLKHGADQSLISLSESVDDDIGIIELSEVFETSFADASEAMMRINVATEAIGKKVESGVTRMKLAAEKKPAKRSDAKRFINKAASDLSRYSVQLEKEVPTLRDAMQTGLNAFSRVLALWPEIYDDSQRGQVEGWIAAMQNLRGVFTSVESQLAAFQMSASSLPSLSLDMNRARRAVVKGLDGLIQVLSSQRALLEQAEAVADAILKKDGKPT